MTGMHATTWPTAVDDCDVGEVTVIYVKYCDIGKVTDCDVGDVIVM